MAAHHPTGAAGADTSDRAPLRKGLALDFDGHRIALGKVEGMASGPDLPRGCRTPAFVSDDN